MKLTLSLELNTLFRPFLKRNTHKFKFKLYEPIFVGIKFDRLSNPKLIELSSLMDFCFKFTIEDTLFELKAPFASTFNH